MTIAYHQRENPEACMVSISSDKSANRITIKVVGATAPPEIKNSLELFQKSCLQLRQPIHVITDLTLAQPNSEDEYHNFCKISQKLSKVFEFDKVIRVVGNSRDILVTMSRLDKVYNLKGIQYVPTMREALNLIGKD